MRAEGNEVLLLVGVLIGILLFGILPLIVVPIGMLLFGILLLIVVPIGLLVSLLFGGSWHKISAVVILIYTASAGEVF